MRTLKHPAVLLAAMLIFVGACVSTQKAAYTTLYSLENSVTASYDSYLALVVKGKIATNDVPRLSKEYDQFQSGMKSAVELAQFDWTKLAPTDVVHLGNVVLHSVAEIKAR